MENSNTIFDEDTQIKLAIERSLNDHTNAWTMQNDLSNYDEQKELETAIAESLQIGNKTPISKAPQQHKPAPTGREGKEEI